MRKQFAIAAVLLGLASSFAAQCAFAQCAGCGADYNRRDRTSVDTGFVFEPKGKEPSAFVPKGTEPREARGSSGSSGSSNGGGK